MLRTRPWVPYLYVAPATALLALIFAYPIVKVIDFSTRLIRGSSGPRVGTLNYRLVFEDPTFRDAAKHSALLLLAVPVLLFVSVVVSVLLYERMRGWKLYRSILFIPYILAVPIVGIVASYLFALNGVVNSILRGMGLDGLALDEPLELRHRDELDPEQDAVVQGRLPCILIVEAQPEILLGPEELEGCAGDPVRLIALINDALTNRP